LTKRVDDLPARPRLVARVITREMADAIL
ncbi:MAG: hypothetical protein RJA86_1196, partial [Pseudomonadota bacterium]